MKEVDFSKPLQVFMMNEQPFTCGYCGSRCEKISSFIHTNFKATIEKCLNTSCAIICYEQQDDNFLKLWEVI